MEGHAGELEVFLGHFTSRLRRDVLSIYKPPKEGEKKGRYTPRRSALTPGDVTAHLCSTPALGMFLLTPGAPDTCLAAVVDLDDKEKKLSWPELCREATAVARELEAVGFIPWPCRSGSGHGVHLWLLWNEPQSAAAVRAQLKEAVRRSGATVHIDYFPGQDRLVEGQVGSLVALPLARASRPITHLAAGEVAEELARWSPASPPRSAPARALGSGPKKAVAAGDFGPVDLPTLQGALGKIAADSYEVWLKVGMALKQGATDGQLPEDIARAAWDAWSATDPKYSEREQAYQWSRLKPDGSLTLGTVWHLAEAGGWRRPKGAAERARDGEEILKLNESHFLCAEGGRVFIFREEWDEYRRRWALTHYGAPDFKLKYLNQRLTVGHTKQGVPVTEDLGTAWLNSTHRRQYEKITLRPEGAPADHYNLWKGWAVEPSEAGSCQKFLAHVRANVCRGDDISYEYLLNWCAQTVQRPQEPIGVAVVLRGDRGTGKGTFARAFGELFGQHYLHIFNSRDLTGKFNAHLRDCIFLFADEAVWAGSKQEESVLKGIITEPELPIEGKGRDLITVRNMLHLLISTNNEWSAPAGLDERRFFALHVSEDKKQNTAYFKPILKELAEGGSARFLWELLNRDLHAFSAYDVPQTAELVKQKLLSLDPWAEWWYGRLVVGTLLEQLGEWGDPVPFQGLYLDYVRHCKMGNQRGTRSPEHLNHCLRGILPREPVATRRRLRRELLIGGEVLTSGSHLAHWELPSLGECRAFFAQKAKADIDWGAAVQISLISEGNINESADLGDDTPLFRG